MYPTKYTTPLLGLDFLEWYPKHNVWHPGVDYGLAGTTDLGNEVVSIRHGFVEYVHNNLLTSGGFGRFVIIQHDDGNFTRYGHLQSVLVNQFEEVTAGQRIGTLGGSGTTESTYSPHLHFESFKPSMAEIQRKHWRPFRYYPSGKDKTYIQEHYINPWDYMEEKLEGWQKTTVDYFKDLGIISDTTNWTNDQIRTLEVMRKLDLFRNQK